MEDLANDLLANLYKNYLYAYPHKTAYRKFPEPINLRTLWHKSAAKQRTLYIHIPFCLHKCGYCNLFSSTCCDKMRISSYVDTLIAEIKAVSGFLALQAVESPVSRVIFGGGTPTILDEHALQSIMEALAGLLHIDFAQVFFSLEISPSTLTESKLALLKQYHIDRISVGVQSFIQQELNNMYRTETVEDITRACKLLCTENLPLINVDLIYGIPAQTLETWEISLDHSLAYKPAEIYLYPLYIREKTGLYAQTTRDIDLMRRMYLYAKDFLQKHNYVQTSMRNFIRQDTQVALFPAASCQENEMLGIGCGARSYRGNVHYAKKYAVEQKNIAKIIDDYLHEQDFSLAHYGYILTDDELKRRYILKSILKVSGLHIADYRQKFKASPVAEFAELAFLIKHAFLTQRDGRIFPTAKGLMCSDAVGCLFISPEVASKMAAFNEIDELGLRI